MKRFTMTHEHLTLLRHANVSWNDAEYGAPTIDPKRPYGNSSVADDIRELLDLKHPDEGDHEDLYDADVDQIHRELETALEIVLRTGKFEPGTYSTEDYGGEWALEGKER